MAVSESPTVKLPVQSTPSRDQLVVGRLSAITSSIEEFRGIPYGIVPNRWEHSLLRTSLPQDIFDASHHGPKCPQPAAPNNTNVYQSQLDFPEVAESELECLNLFIVRPSLITLSEFGHDTRCDPLPVLFYIHGGGFAYGAGTDPIWDPTRMIQSSLALRKPFIAVVINYRLNLFGFAASASIITAQEGQRLKGCNFGIGDQRIALQWVISNIASFGGDPHNITLVGQSAGGCSVHTHVLESCTSSRPPLFQRAIIQSGAFTSVGIGPVPLDQCEERWNALCDHFGLSELPAVDRMTTLQNTPASELIRASIHLGWFVFYLADDSLTVTSLPNDGWMVDFEQNTSTGHRQNIPSSKSMKVLLGYTDAEGSLFIAGALPKLTSYSQIRAIFHETYSVDADVDDILELYGMKPETSLIALHQSLTDFITDVTFGYSVYSAYEDLSKQHHEDGEEGVDHNAARTQHTTSAQLYQIKFGNPFEGPSSRVAHHCVDLIYIFDAFHDALDERDRHEQSHPKSILNASLRQDMQNTWINFIVGKDQDFSDDTILIFDSDRSSKLESLSKNSEWAERVKKFNLIAAHRQEAATVMERIFKLAS